MEGRIKEMKQFLDTYGKYYANDNEFLNLFALPYMPNPQSNQNYKYYFDSDFHNAFKDTVKSFLIQAFPGKAQNSTLVKMAQAWTLFGANRSNMNSKQKMIDLLKQRDQLLEENKHFKSEFSEVNTREEYYRTKLQDDSSKWSGISKELLETSVNIMNRVSLLDQSILSDKWFTEMSENLKRYNYFINLMTDEAGVNPAKILQNNNNFNQSKIYEHNSTRGAASVAYGSESILDDNFKSKKLSHFKNIYSKKLKYLDYNKIKEIINSKSEKVPYICSMLQAISWRYEYTSKNQNISLLYDLSSSDFFNLKSIKSYVYLDEEFTDLDYKIPDVLFNLVYGFGLKVKQYAIRLMNTLASETDGRSYLLFNDSIIFMLYDIMIREKTETLLRQDALGALQKFSLRRHPQDVMLKLNMINYLVNLLSNELESMSEYSLEYSTALLMNLALRKLGKDKCERIGTKVLNQLLMMIDHKNEQVRTYVNGILYSVLSRHSLRKNARDMNVKDILESMMESADDKFIMQYKYIINQIGDTSNENLDIQSEVGDDESEQPEDYDDMDEDVNIEDENFSQFNIPTGEEVLKQFYSSKNHNEYQDTLTKRSELNNNPKSNSNRDRNDIFRPTTPSLKNSFNTRKQTPIMSGTKNYSESMTNTYATNILSESGNKNASDYLGSMSIQKIKNKTPRGQFKHSIGTSARRNDEDPDTISEHNAESLSRDNDADIDDQEDEEEEEEEGDNYDENEEGDEDDQSADEDDDTTNNNQTNRNSRRSILKKSFDKQNRNNKMNNNNSKIRNDMKTYATDTSVDPANLRETEIAFGGYNKIDPRKKNIDDIVVGPKNNQNNMPKEVVIPEGFEVLDKLPRTP